MEARGLVSCWATRTAATMRTFHVHAPGSPAFHVPLHCPLTPRQYMRRKSHLAATRVLCCANLDTQHG